MGDNIDDVVASFLEELLTPLEEKYEDICPAKANPIPEKNATQFLLDSASVQQSVSVSSGLDDSPKVSLDKLDDTKTSTVFVESELTPLAPDIEPETSRQAIFLSKFADANSGEFKVITFGFGGAMTLAIPLAQVRRVACWPEKTHQLPGQRSWLIGSVFEDPGSSYMLVDTHSLIFSSNHESGRSSGEMTRVLVLNDSKWALAVGSVGEIVSLNAQDVDWRSGVRRNLWSIGVVKESMASLLNSEELIKFAISKS